MAPWLTIATVVKDDAAGFERTLASVDAHDLGDVELVVVDSSVDRDSVPAALTGLSFGGSVHLSWSPPSGIYPAMNDALAAATGDYVYFLNAGDELAERTVLAQVREALASDEATWAFGPVEIVERSGAHVITPSWDYRAEKRALFSRGLFPAHQGTFARRNALVSLGGFDLSYRISADYAMALRLSLVGDPLLLPFVIARFHEGGTSTEDWRSSFAEFHRARREILAPTGTAALRERWETARHYGLVYAHRELRPRLEWGPFQRSDRS